MYLAGEKRYTAVQDNFTKIPGSPMAYWVSENLISCFKEKNVESVALSVCKGSFTGNNNKYLRLWYEVNIISVPDKWHPYSKGGAFRRWYGNSLSLIMWENNGEKLKKEPKAGVGASKYYGKEHLVWSGISTGLASFRYDPKDIYFDDVSPAVIFECKFNWQLLGALNSKVMISFLKLIAPTMHFQAGDIKVLPLGRDYENVDENIIKNTIKLSKTDWDSFETSWDFTQHPLVRCKSFPIEEIQEGAKKHIKDMNYIEEAYRNWETECFLRFNQLKSNEEELNRIFINVYGLQDELTPEVEDKDITVRKADLGRDIRSFISYAVGCMFGRYSLNQDGLMFAGGDMKDIYAFYGGTFADTANIRMDGQYTFGELGTPFYYFPVDGKEPLECWKVDADNVIPITDEEYFADDIVIRFAEFVKAVYGEETLEENLEFIASVLGNKSFSSREAIRNYFLKDFFKDHCKIYQKRPIYWLFDSGKQNGFKCLIYMHRYNKDTLNLIRSEYLHKTQNAVENALKNAEYIIQSSASTVERANATKDKDKYVKQLNEMRIYNQALSHLALQKIEIDLDDGMKHNYQLFQGIEVIVDGGKKQKVDLLAKI